MKGEERQIRGRRVITREREGLQRKEKNRERRGRGRREEGEGEGRAHKIEGVLFYKKVFQLRTDLCLSQFV